MKRALWLLGGPARTVLVGVLRAYRVAISPAFGDRCRFFPSCSAYAEEAVRTHGAVKGSALSVWRVLRCSPLSRGGVDPVPRRGTPQRQRSSGPLAYDAVIRRK